MRVRLEPAAEAEVAEATIYLARQSELIADEFIDDLRKARQQIADFPKSGSPIGRGIRRIILKQFPYQLVYRVEAAEIVVYAVAHLKRRPRYWRKRMP